MKKKGIFKFFLATVVTFLVIFPSQVKAKEVDPVRKGLKPGEVSVSKTATPVEGMVNQWDVTLRVEGRNIFPPPQTDIVLVIDNSNSMAQKTTRNGNSRMDKAKEAASKFINQMLEDGYNNRIGIITYGTKAQQVANLTGNSGKQQLLTTINGSRYGKGIQANGGGTHTQEGIRKGMELLESKGSSDARKILVLISDGMPTFSYDMTSSYKNNTSNLTYDANNRRYVTSENIPTSAFTRGRIGNGQDMFIRNGWAFSNKYISMGNNAISESNNWKNKTNANGQNVVSDVYTVSVDMDKSEQGDVVLPTVAVTGTDVLRKIASKPSLCFSVEGAQIEEALTRIGQQLLSAVKDGNVVDPIGEGFELTEGTEIKVSQGNYTVDSSGTIKWDVGTLAEAVSTDPDEDVMYAEMTYRIDATQDVLNSGVINTEGFAKTNGTTTFDYTDTSDKKVTKEFTVPEVKPTIVSVKKELKDSAGNNVTNSQEKFAISLDEEGYAGGKYSLSPEQTEKIVHPWKANKDYNVKENLTSSQKYSVVTSVNNIKTEGAESKFKFIVDNNTGFYQNQNIVIENSTKKTIHIRQAVIDDNGYEIPDKGIYQLTDQSESLPLLTIESGSTKFVDAKDITLSLFTEYLIPEAYQKDNLFKLTPNENAYQDYDLEPYGYVVTDNNKDFEKNHSIDSSFMNYSEVIDLDFETTSEYWVTVFLVISSQHS